MRRVGLVIVGFLTSAITLHIATLLLLDEPSLVKAIAVAASFWLVATLFVRFHVRGSLLYGLSGQSSVASSSRRLYGIGIGHALVVFWSDARRRASRSARCSGSCSRLSSGAGAPVDLRAHAGSGCPPPRSWV